MSSSALLILGMLLVPLNVAAAVRLLLSAQMSPGLLVLGLLAVSIGVGGLYVTATLVSGILDRALQRQHPRIFLVLASVQLAVPVLVHLPFWPLLVVCHGVLLAVLAYGVVLFTQDWLHAIFIERRKLAYYAAGTLVYAALVSFVHVTWGYQEALVLPPGYYGPLLIVVCGLLFYVDAHLKPWRQQAAVLSHLSFGLYGLSIIALLLAVKTPMALLCTLILAVALYGFVTWQYATLPPLYLLLGCTGWLYHEVILHHLPYAWYFVGSLPAWVGLWAASRWALQQRATTLALVGYRVLVVAMLSVAAWSVAQAQPGWVALVTALLVMGGAFAAPRVLPTPLFCRRQAEGVEDEAIPLVLSGAVAQSLWLYLGTGAGLVAVAYTPPVPGLAWAVQFAWGLLLLAAVWTAQGLRLSRITREGGTLSCAPSAVADAGNGAALSCGPSADAVAGNEETARSTALLNSAVLYLGVCLGLGVLLGLPDATYHRSLPLLLGVEGGLALWLSLALGVQWLFYGVLGLWGAAALVKLTYFPASGSGLTMMGVALLIWGVLWRVERVPGEVATLRQERAALREARAASLTLLWYFPVTFQLPQTVVRVPSAAGYGAGVEPGCRTARMAPPGRPPGVDLASLCHARDASRSAHNGLFGVAVAAASRYDARTGGLARRSLQARCDNGRGVKRWWCCLCGADVASGSRAAGPSYGANARSRGPSAWGPYTAGAHNALDSLYDDGAEPGHTTRAVWGVYPPGGFRPDPWDRHGVLGPGSPALSAAFAQVSGTRERHAGGCVALWLELACPAGISVSALAGVLERSWPGPDLRAAECGPMGYGPHWPAFPGDCGSICSSSGRCTCGGVTPVR